MLHQLVKTTTTDKKRLGRGYGSGKGGHTSSRGQKGQKSRSGYKPARSGWEGGQMPLSRRLPKLKGFSRGFIKSTRKEVSLSLSDLNVFKDGDTVSPDALLKLGVIYNKTKKLHVKILANGELNRKLVIEQIKVSAAAKAIIEAKGGKVS